MSIESLTNINEIKSIIRNSSTFSSTRTYAETLFNRNFLLFDFEFIDEYFSLYKKSYFKADYYKNFSRNIENKQHFINWLIWKGTAINKANKVWFTEPHIRFKTEHFCNIISSMKKIFGEDTEHFNQFECIVLGNLIKYINDSKFVIENRKQAIVNGQTMILENSDFSNEEMKKLFHDTVISLFAQYPQETIHLTAIKGLHPTFEQEEILKKDEQFFSENKLLVTKKISAGRWNYYNSELLKNFKGYQKLFQFEVRNSTGSIVADSIQDRELKSKYFVERTKLSQMKDNIEKGVSLYYIPKYINIMISQMNQNSVYKLLKSINIGRLSQNESFLRDLSYYVDNYGNISDDNIELLIMSYKI